MAIYPPPEACPASELLGAWHRWCQQLVPAFEAEELLERARESTGLKDFGTDTWREPCERLLPALDDEARLNTLGRVMSRPS